MIYHLHSLGVTYSYFLLSTSELGVVSAGRSPSRNCNAARRNSLIFGYVNISGVCAMQV